MPGDCFPKRPAIAPDIDYFGRIGSPSSLIAEPPLFHNIPLIHKSFSTPKTSIVSSEKSWYNLPSNDNNQLLYHSVRLDNKNHSHYLIQLELALD